MACVFFAVVNGQGCLLFCLVLDVLVVVVHDDLLLLLC